MSKEDQVSKYGKQARSLLEEMRAGSSENCERWGNDIGMSPETVRRVLDTARCRKGTLEQVMEAHRRWKGGGAMPLPEDSSRGELVRIRQLLERLVACWEVAE